jgi:hypothetical protein
MTKTLDDWFTASKMIAGLYDVYLGRNLYNDPEALTNWLFHWREYDHDMQWFIDRFIESDEYKNKHGNIIPTPPIPPITISPSSNSTILNTPILIAKGVNPIGMSYWRNINQHKNQSDLKVILSKNDQLTLYTVDKSNLSVVNSENLGITHTGEGVFFSSSNPNIIYVPFDEYVAWFNVETKENGIVLTGQGYKIWQLHCDYSEKIWSMTLKDNNYNIVEWGVYKDEYLKTYDLKGKIPDECQIDKSGKWLLIKEDDDNRIIYIPTGVERFISNQNGALGHGDCGFEFAMGENDYSQFAGALDIIKFEDGSHINIYSSGIWNMGYVSYTNAKDANTNTCLMTTPKELILINIDTKIGRVICPNLTDIDSYPGKDKYPARAKANLCPNGQYAAWTAYVNGSMNCYLVAF